MEQPDLFSFLLTICCSVFPAIPFAIIDIYFSFEQQCLNYISFSKINLNGKMWLLVNGCVSLSSVIFTFIILTIVYNKTCNSLVKFFENSNFIRTYIFLKLLFNISWTITGTIIFSSISNHCRTNIQIYIWIRISVMFLFIILSIRSIKKHIVDNPIEVEDNI